MADYSQYQGPNPEWEQFTQGTVLPPVGLAPGETLVDYQRSRNALREKDSRVEMERSGLSEKVSWEDVSIPTRDASTIPARIYKTKRDSDGSATAPLPVYLFFHGGGYLFGSIESEDANCSRVVAMSPYDSVIVVHVNHRHTPAFKYPVPHHDAWDAFLWLDKNITSIGGDCNKVIVGGISAGGGLAASVVLHAQELPSSGLNITVAGQLLLIPWLVHPKAYPFDMLASKERSSFVQNSDAPILPLAQITIFTDALSGPDTDPTDIYLSPLFASDEKIRGMPKTVFVVAGMDPLRDEALLYADKLKRNGVPAKVNIFPGLPHGFRRFGSLKASARWDELIVEGIQWCLSDNLENSTQVELP
ncbi:hypothetical protein PV04_09923 [Phialophora macrospora]|uniref:Alpha/beta hydrolase fold-3 domain-containing protein n=1 Tax=Phialophora macrospora TaxID=1851006 RepID=A0A0D2F818_9EURO|nr:hypothetical protein PV04_09923 [Phialophora macrospora]